jgi:NADPH-dependent 2,4-dienoyl-CoA reductase/sulfur reductase-like enzyme
MSAAFCGMGICFQCCGAGRVRTCMPRPDAPLDRDRLSAQVAVIGAGPAGLAAADAAARQGVDVLLIDDNAAPGGQIWRGDAARARTAGRIHALTRTSVAGAAGGILLAQRGDQPITIAYESLILCTGARERWIPFPGWTLPHVTGAGGLQALVKNGLAIEGQRVVVGGTGPLLLAVAAYLKQRGARVMAVVEQAPEWRVNSFAGKLLASPAKLLRGAALRARLLGVPYLTDAWIVEADEGAVTVEQRGSRRRIGCDRVAVGFGLVPNVELARVLGCHVSGGRVLVDALQRTSLGSVWCAGEPAGIGGVDCAVVEGRIAGLAAAGDFDAARSLTGDRDRARQFASALDEAFALRRELSRLPADDTIVCRCEEVPFGRIRRFASSREAKLQTRCGMGPCQGRVCGPAMEALLGWRDESVRPPALPVTVAALAANTSTTEDRAE